jgi:hypothetical protein
MPAKGWRKRQTMQWIPEEEVEVTGKIPPDWTQQLIVTPTHIKSRIFAGERRECVSSIHKTLDEVNLQRKREWVGLTDEDIKEIIGYYGDLNVNGYARQLFAKIEAKLREKNT